MTQLETTNDLLITCDSHKCDLGEMLRPCANSERDLATVLEASTRLSFDQVWVHSFCDDQSCAKYEKSRDVIQSLIKSSSLEEENNSSKNKLSPTKRSNSTFELNAAGEFESKAEIWGDRGEIDLNITNTKSSGESNEHFDERELCLNHDGGRKLSVFSDERRLSDSGLSSATDLSEETESPGFLTPVASCILQWILATEREIDATGKSCCFRGSAHDFLLKTQESNERNEETQEYEDEEEYEEEESEEEYEDEEEESDEDADDALVDPYRMILPSMISKVVHGRCQKQSGLVQGLATIRLVNNDELLARFSACNKHIIRDNDRCGSLELHRPHKRGLVMLRSEGFSQGRLSGFGRALLRRTNEETDYVIMKGLREDEVELEGIFVQGRLQGLVRGLNRDRKLVFLGHFKRGLPNGHCWVAQKGKGWIYGTANDQGELEKGAYIYPDLSTALVGTFREGRLMRAQKALVIAVSNLDEVPTLEFEFPAKSEGETSTEMSQAKGEEQIYDYSPSDSTKISCSWLLEDIYEQRLVYCACSSVTNAGDGLFARMDLPSNVVVAFYNGLKVQQKDRYAGGNGNYQIYVDWTQTESSAYMDVPVECVDTEVYRASLAHKANHSFEPNCVYVVVQHPVFGRIPALKTIRAVAKNEEIFAHYKYDMALAPQWYLMAWEQIKTA